MGVEIELDGLGLDRILREGAGLGIRKQGIERCVLGFVMKHSHADISIIFCT